MSERKIHYARKAGNCVNRRPAEVGNAPECKRTIEVGQAYVDGDLDPYKAGGFGKDRVCLGCALAGHA